MNSICVLALLVVGVVGELSIDNVDLLLRAHNYIRRLAYYSYWKGSAGLPLGANMLEMFWDDSLAMEAAAYAKGCVFEHSEQSAWPPEFGENLAMSSAPTQKEQVLDALKIWKNEVYDISLDPSSDPVFTEAIAMKAGHLTQMIWAKSHRIGCGMQDCAEGALLVCRYTPSGNLVGEPMYRKGIPCRDCDEGSMCNGPVESPRPANGDYFCTHEEDMAK